MCTETIGFRRSYGFHSCPRVTDKILRGEIEIIAETISSNEACFCLNNTTVTVTTLFFVWFPKRKCNVLVAP